MFVATFTGAASADVVINSRHSELHDSHVNGYSFLNFTATLTPAPGSATALCLALTACMRRRRC